MADTTYIERNSTETWSMGAGTEIYNSSGGSYSDTGLSEGTTYYYQAWSWNNTDGNWSCLYSSDYAKTKTKSHSPLPPPSPYNEDEGQDTNTNNPPEPPIRLSGPTSVEIGMEYNLSLIHI